VLTLCFGEGEAGPGRQPRHRAGEDLARVLLSRGADPNDAQTLYNRMFGRDDGHLRILLERRRNFVQAIAGQGRVVGVVVERQVTGVGLDEAHARKFGRRRPAPTERQRFRRDVKDVDAGTRPLLRNQSRQVAGAATNLENPAVTRADAFCHGLMRVPG
jgi:hypothetical protein